MVIMFFYQIIHFLPFFLPTLLYQNIKTHTHTHTHTHTLPYLSPLYLSSYIPPSLSPLYLSLHIFPPPSLLSTSLHIFPSPSLLSTSLFIYSPLPLSSLPLYSYIPAPSLCLSVLITCCIFLIFTFIPISGLLALPNVIFLTIAVVLVSCYEAFTLQIDNLVLPLLTFALLSVL